MRHGGVFGVSTEASQKEGYGSSVDGEIHTCSSHYILTDMTKSLPSPSTRHQVPIDVDNEGGDHKILLGHDIVEECSEQQCQGKDEITGATD